MVVNALNSGAKTFMADFEGALSVSSKTIDLTVDVYVTLAYVLL